jgi:hypothetical protein
VKVSVVVLRGLPGTASLLGRVSFLEANLFASFVYAYVFFFIRLGGLVLG